VLAERSFEMVLALMAVEKPAAPMCRWTPNIRVSCSAS
jgi:hypothetical protein